MRFRCAAGPETGHRALFTDTGDVAGVVDVVGPRYLVVGSKVVLHCMGMALQFEPFSSSIEPAQKQELCMVLRCSKSIHNLRLSGASPGERVP